MAAPFAKMAAAKRGRTQEIRGTLLAHLLTTPGGKSRHLATRAELADARDPCRHLSWANVRCGMTRDLKSLGPAGSCGFDPHPRQLVGVDSERAWDHAAARAQLEDFTFHDLRHTAASNLAMSGATTAEIAAVLGHKTLAMVKRYAHIGESHTAEVVGRMNAKFLGGRF